MIAMNNFVQPGVDNFPVLDNIYDLVPIPIVTEFPAIAAKKYKDTSCQLVGDITRDPPTFEKNPLCFTIPRKPDIKEEFIAARKATIAWQQRSKTDNNTKFKASDAIYTTNTRVGRQVLTMLYGIYTAHSKVHHTCQTRKMYSNPTPPLPTATSETPLVS